MNKSSGNLKLIGVEIPTTLVRRLELEAIRTGQTRRSIIERALDAQLPKHIRVVVGREAANDD